MVFINQLDSTLVSDLQPVTGHDDCADIYTGLGHYWRRYRPGREYQARQGLDLLESNPVIKAQVVRSQIESPPGHEGFWIKHESLTETHPWQWSPEMLKDVALFHCGLSVELIDVGFTLKDALPSNVLFDRGRPILVDFASIVSVDDLSQHTWLKDLNGKGDLRSQIIQRMFVPFMLIPTLVGQTKSWQAMSRILRTRQCNSGRRAPGANSLLTVGDPRKSWAALTLLREARLFAENLDPRDAYAELAALINGLPEQHLASDYLAYYEDKSADVSLTLKTNWDPKQIAVDKIIEQYTPSSVLDVGCNTGWYSLLAENHGARVISIDSDSACIDSLFRVVRGKNLKIDPMVADLDSVHDQIYLGATESPARSEKEGLPLQTLRSDLVLFLGLAHHIILGKGWSIQKLFNLLDYVSKDVLILEFVNLDDEKIMSEPQFFPSLPRMADHYSMEEVIACALRHFRSHEILPSDTDSRTIIVFAK